MGGKRKSLRSKGGEKRTISPGEKEANVSWSFPPGRGDYWGENKKVHQILKQKSGEKNKILSKSGGKS